VGGLLDLTEGAYPGIADTAVDAALANSTHGFSGQLSVPTAQDIGPGGKIGPGRARGRPFDGVTRP
jgi:hypothetical protein